MPEDDKRVDPRYDPAFQRGFDGPVTSGLRTRSVQRSALVTPAPFRSPDTRSPDTRSPDTRSPDTRSAASRTGESETPVEPGMRQPREAELTRSAVIDEPEEAPEFVEPGAPRKLSRNPFLIALTVLGAAMTLGGIAWANQARMLVATRGGAATDLDYWFLQASVVAAPLTIIAGIGILAGVLFIAATAWNRRP